MSDNKRCLTWQRCDNNPVSMLNPITKIITIFTLGISSMVWPDPCLGIAFIVVLFVVAIIARIVVPYVKLMFGFGIPMTLMLMFIQGLYSPSNKTFIADFGFAKLGLEGMIYAGRVVVTVLVFLGSFYIMNKTTYIGSMVAALTGIGLPAKIGYLVLASLNVVPQMQRRMSVISQAQSARGLKMSGSAIGRLRALIPLLGPVVLSSLTDAQERGMTLETRGFGINGVKRTSIVEVQWRVYDSILTYMLLLILAISLVLSTCFYVGIIPYYGGLK